MGGSAPQILAYSSAAFCQSLAASRKDPTNASTSLSDSGSLSIAAVDTMKSALRFIGNLEAVAAEILILSPPFPVQILERR